MPGVNLGFLAGLLDVEEVEVEVLAAELVVVEVVEVELEPLPVVDSLPVVVVVVSVGEALLAVLLALVLDTLAELLELLPQPVTRIAATTKTVATPSLFS